MKPGTYWNGKRCPARQGSVVVAKDARPFYWGRDLAGQRVAVVRVDIDHDLEDEPEPFYLLDHDGRGWRKVTVLRGGPQAAHQQVVAEPGTWREGREGAVTDQAIEAAMAAADERMRADPRGRSMLEAVEAMRRRRAGP